MPAVVPRLDPAFVRHQIELLRLAQPDLWDGQDDELLADMLEAETALPDLLASIVGHLQTTDAFAFGLDELIDNLKIRRDRYQGRRDALRGLALRMMNWAGVRKFELPAATLSIRAGTQKVIITNEGELPDDCVRIKREPDKTAIKENIAAGGTVPGAELSNAEPSLMVKVR